MSKMSQCDKVLLYMEEFGKITQRDALRFGCYRLGGRIYDLRKRGVVIISEMKEVQNADGSTSKIAVYSIPKVE